MPKLVYTREQLQFLGNGCLWMAIGKLTEAFNRRFGLNKTEGQIKSTLKNHKIRGGRAVKTGNRNNRRLLTIEQKNFVEEMYPFHSAACVTAALNRRFGLAIKTSQLKTYVFNHGIKSGRDGCFVPGDLPWNTGTKGTGTCKPNSGTFRKGNIPGNVRELGAERIDTKDGYVHIKVAEENPYTGAKTRFKQKHVVEWERRNGPVPSGMVVRMLDGNKENCSPENLLLVTKAEHLRLTQLDLSEYPQELKKSVVALAKLDVKTFARKRELSQAI